MDISPYRWIVFDLDNTLFPESLHQEAWKLVLPKFKIKYSEFCSTYLEVVYEKDVQAHGSFSSGAKLQETLNRLEVENAEATADKLLKRFRAAYRNLIKRYLKQQEEKFQILHKMRENHRIAILSNNSLDTKFEYQRIFTQHGLDVFDAFIVSEEVGYRKPDPEIFKYMLQEIDSKAEDVLFIGDKPLSDGASRSVGIDFIQLYGHKEIAHEGEMGKIKDIDELKFR